MTMPVDRLEKVEIKYINKDWQIKFAKFDDLLSTIIQHEYDHLKGKLIID
jgi:peptide deformylase